ncbi:MAG: xylose isomerase [Phycisphaerae bacterium]|nr:xylose isomerase [Phycisphaerae bacterium]
MERRTFISAAGGAAVAGVATGASAATIRDEPDGGPFKLKYAPHFGMFNAVSGDDQLDQLRYAREQGFTAWEDNGMPGRSDADQKKIGDEMRRLGIEMGVFVAEADFGAETFVKRDEATTARLESKMNKAVEIAGRCGARWITVVPGRYGQSEAWEFQTANVIENLKHCAAILEPHGLVMVLEPLNRRDHPGLFLTGVPQAFMICEAVGSPSCKILDDLYHQQITEGNLIPYMNRAWSEIAYFQVGDNPGRREPTTGEIDYRNVFRHIRSRGFQGIVGMEHGMSRGGKEGVERLIAAYRECDRFRD